MRRINLKMKKSGLQGTAILTICRLLKIDVGVAQGFSGDHVPADTDGQDRARLRELFEQHSLGDVRVQIPDVEGRHRITWTGWIHLFYFLRRVIRVKQLGDDRYILHTPTRN